MKIALYIHHPEVEAWRFTDEQVRELKEKWPNDEIIWVKSEKEFLDCLGDVEGALVWRFEPDWFDVAPKLRWLATPAAGKDHLPAVPPEGVTYTFGHFHGAIMSETVVGMMLSACRNLFGWRQPQACGESWPQAVVSEPMRLLAGSHVVLCGFGPIGKAIGQRLKSFQVRLTVIRREPGEIEDWMTLGDQVVAEDVADRSRVWSEADHVVLALPGGEETHHFLSRERIEALPNRAWVYNVGRGSCIDEEALIDQLNQKGLEGVFLDVFEEEPLPQNSPLRIHERAFLLPHVSAVTREYLPLFLQQVSVARNAMASSFTAQKGMD